MATSDDYDQGEDLGWFRDELRQRDRLIAELRQEQDEAADLIRRLRENAEDYTASIESWCKAFGMELTDNGWTWKPFWNEYARLNEKYRQPASKKREAAP